MRSSGYRELVDAPFDLDLRLATSAVGDYAALSGFVVRPAQPSDDLVAVHRAAWHPPDLPFAEGHRPPFAPDAAICLVVRGTVPPAAGLILDALGLSARVVEPAGLPFPGRWPNHRDRFIAGLREAARRCEGASELVMRDP